MHLLEDTTPLHGDSKTTDDKTVTVTVPNDDDESGDEKNEK